MNVIMLLHHLHDWNMAWSPELDVGLLVRSAWHVVTAETQQTDLDPKSLSSLSEKTCCVTISWLVVSNMNGLFYIIFHFIYGMSSFPLTHIFFKMVIAPHWIILNPCGIFQRDSRYIYFEEQVVMSKESTKCRNAQQELNFCHKRRQKTFPEHPESDGWAMQRPHHKKHTQWLLGTCSNIFHQKTVDVAHRVAPQRLV